ncbi:MAG: hypothetical protein AAGD14_18145 [Planctomycetota bacterium]
MRVVLLVLLLTASARAERWVRDAELHAKIDASVQRGVSYLLARQQDDGRWAYAQFGLRARPGEAPDPYKRFDPAERRERAAQRRTHIYDGALTSVVLYALAASGTKRDAEPVRRALAWIREHPTAFDDKSDVGTYATALQILALARFEAGHFGPEIRSLADRLARGRDKHGTWGLKLDRTRKPIQLDPRMKSRRNRKSDHANTQAAVCALWAAHSLAGWDSPSTMWRQVREHFARAQREDGAWGFRPRDEGTASMTAAGLACYLYARAALDGRESALAQARRSKTAMDGLRAFRRSMREPDWNDYFEVLSVERVAALVGQRSIDWYERGARMLTSRQKKPGHWQGNSRSRDPDHCYETALALLFLRRATFPPVRGAVSPPARLDAVSIRERAPMISTAATHRQAFEIYLTLDASLRRPHAVRIGGRGKPMIDYLIAVLETDGRTAARQAAHDLLQRLLGKSLLYLAKASPDERRLMARAIHGTWTRMRESAVWNEQSGRFR